MKWKPDIVITEKGVSGKNYITYRAFFNILNYKKKKRLCSTHFIKIKH